MEVDYSATEEVKESAGNAQLHTGESDEGSPPDFSMQIDHGQLQIARLRQLPPSYNYH
jgi:hypothetical protein